MEALDRLQRKSESLRRLRTIVGTMKALSAASIHQYERAADALAGYSLAIERGLHVALRDLETLPPSAGPANPAGTAMAALVFGSDHGFCGRFNETVVAFALEELRASGYVPGSRLVLAIGDRAAAALEHAGQAVEDSLPLPGSAEQITATVQLALLRIDEWSSNRGVARVQLFYTPYARNARSDPAAVQLLPLDLRRFHRSRYEPWPSRRLPTFTMDRDVLLRRLLHHYLFVSIFRACAESQASEYASRLAAMQSAGRNLDDNLAEVTTAYRRARQEAITAELLDVVAGFEAATGGF